MNSKPSGSGWRVTLHGDDGTEAVSIWAHTKDDAELMAVRDDLRHREAMEEYEAKLAREAERQAWAEYRKTRARA